MALGHAVQLSSRVEARTEHDSELVSCRTPFPDISAAFFKVADGQIDQLAGRILGREGATS